MKKLINSEVRRLEKALPLICKQAAQVEYVEKVDGCRVGDNGLTVLRAGHKPKPGERVALAYIQN